MERKSHAWGGDLHYRHLETESAARCVRECLEDQAQCMAAAVIKMEDRMICYLYDDVTTDPMEKEDGIFFTRMCPEDSDGLYLYFRHAIENKCTDKLHSILKFHINSIYLCVSNHVLTPNAVVLVIDIHLPYMF